EWSEEGYSYIDHGSTNGSFINGEKVHKRLLASGDMILIGDTTIKVTIER
ncbi:MAG: FHA domain-containing protein, partial [Nitrospiria bacterium]